MSGCVLRVIPGRARPDVFGHKLVAEALLGRNRLEGESVHHRNGISDDNGPRESRILGAPTAVGYCRRRSLRGERRTSNDAHARA
jgi:hypothetical protein